MVTTRGRVGFADQRARWRERLFALLTRNASDVATYYHLPDSSVVEIGQRLDL